MSKYGVCTLKKTIKCVLLGMAIVMAFATTTQAKVVEHCTASWYGPGFHGRLMANGKPFNEDNPTHLAHKTLPFGTAVEVVNENNGRTLRAVVTDRGPHVSGRCVDLSKAGAIKLGFLNAGTTKVRVQVIN